MHVDANTTLHADTDVCIQRLLDIVEEAQKELEEARTGTFFGAYNATQTEVAMYSGPRFLDLVREMITVYPIQFRSLLRAKVMDMAYTIVHSGLQYQPDSSIENFNYSNEFSLALEFVTWAMQTTSLEPKPKWLTGVV
jgi:hypothetical protein